MTRARIHIASAGLDDMIEAVRSVHRDGPPRAQARLDGVLDRLADLSRDLAHVSHDRRHSGALRASQQVTTEHGPSYWTGEISYLDRSAQYEVQRGADHADYIDALSPASELLIPDALDEVMRDL